MNTDTGFAGSSHDDDAEGPSRALTEPPAKQMRGFACMDPERRKAISSKGGKSAHAKGTGHTFSKEEARVAGRKGGLARHKSRGRSPSPNADEVVKAMTDGVNSLISAVAGSDS